MMNYVVTFLLFTCGSKLFDLERHWQFLLSSEKGFMMEGNVEIY